MPGKPVPNLRDLVRAVIVRHQMHVPGGADSRRSPAGSSGTPDDGDADSKILGDHPKPAIEDHLKTGQ